MDLKVCPFCQKSVSPNDIFCPSCGQRLRIEPFALSTTQIVTTYLISFFLPPAGIYYGIKYGKQDNEKIRSVGKIAILLTAVSLVLTLIMIGLSIKIANDILRQTYLNLPEGMGIF